MWLDVIFAGGAEESRFIVKDDFDGRHPTDAIGDALRNKEILWLNDTQVINFAHVAAVSYFEGTPKYH